MSRLDVKNLCIAALLMLFAAAAPCSAWIGTEDDIGDSYTYPVDQPFQYRYLSVNDGINYQVPLDIFEYIYLIEVKKGDRLDIWADTSAGANFVAMDLQGLYYWLSGDIPAGDSLENHISKNFSVIDATRYNETYLINGNGTLCFVIQPTDQNMSLSGNVTAIRTSRYGPEASVTAGGSLADWIRYNEGSAN